MARDLKSYADFILWRIEEVYKGKQLAKAEKYLLEYFKWAVGHFVSGCPRVYGLGWADYLDELFPVIVAELQDPVYDETNKLFHELAGPEEASHEGSDLYNAVYKELCGIVKKIQLTSSWNISQEPAKVTNEAALFFARRFWRELNLEVASYSTEEEWGNRQIELNHDGVCLRAFACWTHGYRIRLESPEKFAPYADVVMFAIEDRYGTIINLEEDVPCALLPVVVHTLDSATEFVKANSQLLNQALA